MNCPLCNASWPADLNEKQFLCPGCQHTFTRRDFWLVKQIPMTKEQGKQLITKHPEKN